MRFTVYEKLLSFEKSFRNVVGRKRSLIFLIELILFIERRFGRRKRAGF